MIHPVITHSMQSGLSIRRNKMTEQNKQTVNIDGTDYVVDELTDTQKYMLNQVVNLRDRISKARMELDQIQVASSGFTKMLSDSVKGNDDEAA
tara:strand:- start:9027 stop:9305 length:279 start_codon:yes stop_codon:yes gene_type:complete